MPWKHIQDNPGSDNVTFNSNATALSVGAFGSAVSLLNSVVVCVGGAGSSSGSISGLTVTDNGSTPNTYTQAIIKTSSSTGAWVAFYVSRITSNPSSGNLNPKVTVTNSQSLGIVASEFSGAASKSSVINDGNGASSTSNSTSPAPGAVTPTVYEDLVLTAEVNINATISASPTGFTSVGKRSNSLFISMEFMYKILNVSNLNSVSSTWTVGSSLWVACAYILKPDPYPASYVDSPMFPKAITRM